MRIPQGVLNAKAYFQGVLTKLLAGLNCKAWVDDIVCWRADEDDLLKTLDRILGRLGDAGLFAAAHKCLFIGTDISWCEKVYGTIDVSRPGALERIGEHARPADGG